MLSGICQYTPADGFIGQDVFHYTITDSRGASATTTVTVDVVANIAPDALDDSYNVGASLAPSFINVRSNDTDPESDPISVVEHGPSRRRTARSSATPRVASTRAHRVRPRMTRSTTRSSTATAARTRRPCTSASTKSCWSSGSVAPNPSSHGNRDLHGHGVGPRARAADRRGDLPRRRHARSAPSRSPSAPPASRPIARRGEPSDRRLLRRKWRPCGLDRRLLGARPGRDHRRDDDGCDLRRRPVGCRCDGDVHGDGRTVGSTAGIPGGTVSSSTDTVLGSATLNGGSATLATSTLAAGVHDITARYDGDALFTGSTSSVLQHCRHAHGERRRRHPRRGRGSDPRSTSWQRHRSRRCRDAAGSSGCRTPITARHRSMTPGRPATSPTTRSSISPTATSTGSTASRTRSATARRRLRHRRDPGHAGQRSPVAVGQTVSPEVPAGTTRTITLTATDVDGPNLTFTIVDPPASAVSAHSARYRAPLSAMASSARATVDYTAVSASDSFTFRVDGRQARLEHRDGRRSRRRRPTRRPIPIPAATRRRPAARARPSRSTARRQHAPERRPHPDLVVHARRRHRRRHDLRVRRRPRPRHDHHLHRRRHRHGLTLTADDGVNPAVSGRGRPRHRQRARRPSTSPARPTARPSTSGRASPVGDVRRPGRERQPHLHDRLGRRQHRPRPAPIAAGVCTAHHTYLAAGSADDHRDRHRRRRRQRHDTVTIASRPPANPPPIADAGSDPSPAGSEGSAIALHGTVATAPDDVAHPDLVVHARRRHRSRDDLRVRRRPRPRHHHHLHRRRHRHRDPDRRRRRQPAVPDAATVTIANATPTVDSPARPTAPAVASGPCLGLRPRRRPGCQRQPTPARSTGATGTGLDRHRRGRRLHGPPHLPRARYAGRST